MLRIFKNRDFGLKNQQKRRNTRKGRN